MATVGSADIALFYFKFDNRVVSEFVTILRMFWQRDQQDVRMILAPLSLCLEVVTNTKCIKCTTYNKTFFTPGPTSGRRSPLLFVKIEETDEENSLAGENYLKAEYTKIIFASHRRYNLLL